MKNLEDLPRLPTGWRWIRYPVTARWECEHEYACVQIHGDGVIVTPTIPAMSFALPTAVISALYEANGVTP